MITHSNKSHTTTMPQPFPIQDGTNHIKKGSEAFKCVFALRSVTAIMAHSDQSCRLPEQR